MHLVLTGATGLLGSAVLHHMISTPSVSRVSVLSRRPVPQAEGHEKVKVIIHKDFATYPSEVLNQLKDVDGVVWAQGISVTQVTKDEYFSITNTYPLSFARALSQNAKPKPLNFVYVSGEGATTTPGHFTAHFGIIKGQTESELLALSKDHAFANLKPYSLRPAGIDPKDHKEIHEFLPVKKGIASYATYALAALGPFAPSLISPTRDLGKVLTQLASGEIGKGGPLKGKGIEGEGRTISNVGFRRLAGI